MTLLTISSLALIAASIVAIFFMWSFKKSARESSVLIESQLQKLSGELSQNRSESSVVSRQLREEVANSFTNLTQINEAKLENLRQSVEHRLKSLQDDNSQKLELMRSTVDEKLNSTLEKRLGDSFKTVRDQLDQVHRGLGEMQALASGVGDLKKVLTNVKVRGTLGEVQLEAILEQFLSPEQYGKNVSTKEGSRENVEFAVKFPGSREGEPVWLPIDAKFPVEDYQRLMEAQENADADKIEECQKALENRIKSEAKDIRDKYINPPFTTDFAILFLPFEGLFAEVLRRPGLYESIQRNFNTTIAGPTTIAAILIGFQMGFKTLAIEKRSSEVWGLLSQVKSEFGKFGDVLDRANKQLRTVADTMESATRKTRTIERRLKEVQVLPTLADESLLVADETEMEINP